MVCSAVLSVLPPGVFHDDNPLARRCGDVDIVDADARPDDRSQSRLTRKDVQIEVRSASNDNAVGVRKSVSKLARFKSRPHVDFDSLFPLQNRQPLFWKRIGDEHALHCKSPLLAIRLK